MKKNKISIMQISRLLIQIIFFIFLPALYINTFAGIKQIYIAIINQNIAFSQLIPQLIETITIIPFTIIMGRFFCGWMCAYGAFGDFVYKLSSNVFKIKFKMNENTDAALKYFKYVLLAFLIFVICTFNITAFKTFNPWDVFGILASVGKVPDFSYVAGNLTFGFIIFILITIGSVFIERFFCRYLCPLGAVFSITSKLKIAKIKKERTKCGNCRICTNNCAMGIPLYKYDVVNSGECINCMQCIKVCPRRNVTLTVSDEDVKPLVASAVAVSVMTGLYYVGNLGVSIAGLNTMQVETQGNQDSASDLYKNGTYEGSGTGFRGGTTTVSVVVKKGVISDITTVSCGDDRPFYERAANTVFQEIIDSQSTSVDAVSGATFSSNGIMEAVENALESAKLGTSDSIASSTTASTDSNQTEQSSKSEVEVSDSDTSTASDSTTSTSNNQKSSISESQGEASKASNSQTTSPASDVQQTTNSQSDTKAASSSITNTNAKYKDGTYEGSGTGFRGGTTTVSVIVKNGKITDVTTISYEDDRPFYSRAFNTVSEEIISNQTTSVDAVSGATFSSIGIMEAVENALSKANSKS